MKTPVKLYLLLGDPVEGSLSPAMHNAAFKKLRMNSIYVSVKVPRKYLGDIMNGIRALKVAGINITVPHKVAAVDLMDELDDSAAAVEAVNTVVNRNGKLVGYNTDGEGALQALKAKVKSIEGKRIVVLGAGGAARAIAYALATAGGRITIANRTQARGEALASIIREKLRKEVSVISLDKRVLKKAISDADILINATSVGMYPKQNESLVTEEMLHPNLVMDDIVYKPLRTKMLKYGEKVGAKTVYGLGMLVNQAALSFKLWTGRNPPVEVMRAAAKKALGGSR